MKSINLKAIRIDGGTQSRIALNEATVTDYAEAIAEGVKLPPVVVFFDGSDNWLADGFHRFHAYSKAGKASIPAEVVEGTQSDAVLHGAGANASHGLRRTNADKRHAVEMVLSHPDAAEWSDRKIADHCGVSVTFVSAARRPEVAQKRQENRAASAAKRSPATPEAQETKPAKPVEPPKKEATGAEPDFTENDELAESQDVIVSLSEQVDELRAKLAVEQMDASEDEKTAASELIADLRAQVKTLEAELKQMRLSRDTFQSEVRELSKQIAMNKRELQKARAAA